MQLKCMQKHFFHLEMAIGFRLKYCKTLPFMYFSAWRNIVFQMKHAK